ncbi:TAXI family TRAP transporter solute-binding subunit [Methylibium sp.]|uniref:TAXI family TRAP transporter solute-binding subunit n=1 Tax=Methylibium sp. TaxID=2067992 RepID=UPI001802531A|nr:TAXI family TRAP transporter solute-binding subunit [Methylibium sp.]MBA3589968.1 ABC transporter substrate-binding protein [Methylibium sp.]
MPRLPKFRDTLINTRDLLVTGGPFVLIALALLVLAYWALDPTPPKKVTLATGPEQGAYAEFGQRYKAHLQRFGIEVELRATQGSSENLKLLQDPKSGVDFAFVQGGAGRLRRNDEGPPPDLVSLGSLFYEPVWLFYREAAAKEKLGSEQLESLAQLKGWRVNIGAPGSGVTNLMLRLFDANGLAPQDLVVQRLGNTPAVVSLFAGETDALVYTSAPESPLVQMLLLTPGIGLMDFAQAEAYSRRLPVVSPVLLPRGVVKLGEDVPAQDIRLLAPTAMLVAREDAHPALQQLFVQAASAIHSGAGWFQRRGEFPSLLGSELPLAKEAARFFQSGPPFLQRYLPFWLANLIDRMWVVLAGVIVVLIPLSRVLPPLYELRVRSRVFRWYARLRQIEEGLADGLDHARGAQPLMNDLDELDAKVKQLQVPLSHADELYALRSHIDLVRKKLRALGAQTPNPTVS